MKARMATRTPKIGYRFLGFILALEIVLILPHTILAQAPNEVATMKPAAATPARNLSGVWVEQGQQDPKACSKTWTSAPRTFVRKHGYELTEDYCVAVDSLGARKAASPSASEK